MDTSTFDPTPAQADDTTSQRAHSFGELFRILRKQLAGKQACLSGAGLRCTDAAISHWERGHRLPRPKTMRNAIDVLACLGAAPGDIEQLKSAWYAEYIGRKVIARKQLLEMIEKRPYDG
jgi:hypothetical protein